MKLGARILKTGIAIVLALFLADLFQLPSPVFTGIAAIFAIQPTIYRSYKTIIEQIQGNIIGALVAVFFVLLFGNDFFIVGLAAIIVISINLKLKIEKTISLSLVTLIVIMEASGESFIQFAFIRFSAILLGIFSAFIVNLVFIPPKYENKLYNQVASLTEDVIKWIRISTRHASEHQLLKIDIKALKNTASNLDQLFTMYKEERDYFRKNNLTKLRKLVIYRQMVTAVKKALDTLTRLHRYENELNQLPEVFRDAVQEQLDSLISHHEQLMLKFIGKVQPISAPPEGEISLNKKELFDTFLAHLEEEKDAPTLYHTMQVVSAIMDYGEHVEHLDRLINSFQTFHKDKNEVIIEEQ